MIKDKKWEKIENHVIVLVTLLIYIIIVGVCFDFYYDFNDDVFMRNIMSGSYTGYPDAHNVQTLYLLGVFISSLYKLYRGFPWYGVFLLLCQVSSLYLVGVRLLRFCKSLITKLGCMLLFTLFLWSVMLPHMMAVHYTFISAVLAAAAIFLFVTTAKDLTVKQFIIQNIPSIILVILSYQLRREMLLLLFPLIGLAGVFRWSEEEKIFQKDNVQKYGCILSCIIVLMLANRLINIAAYGNGGWKEFFNFDDTRTVVYDYHLDIVTSGEHKEYLYSVGLNDAQQELLSNYNFGLDESINAHLMSKIAEYAAADVNYSETVPSVIYDYYYRTFHEIDAPYNMLVIFLYFCVALTGFFAVFIRKENQKKWAFLWKLAALGATRSALWMFILVRGRYPERITHSLYFAEILLLSGLLCAQLADWIHSQKDEAKMQKGIAFKSALVVFALFCLLCMYYIPQNVRETSADMNKREIAHQNCLEISKYCRTNPENFYFEDVYSMVDSSQKIFCDVDNSLANYDFMGGWLCKSPLYYEKLEKFNISTMEDGLLSSDTVYYIAAKDSDTSWLADYYGSKGIVVHVEQVDSIGDNYAVYHLQNN